MPRCDLRRSRLRLLPGLLALCLAGALAPPLAAQTARRFTVLTLRGELQVLQPPLVRIGTQQLLLTPGARIRDARNMQVLSGALVGAGSYLAHYTLDAAGQVSAVWLLNAAEAANTPWPTTLAQARSWYFDPASQVWIKP